MQVILIIDVQNDYCEHGAVACKGGARLGGKINKYISYRKSSKRTTADFIIGTQEWHPANHASFRHSNNGLSEVEVSDVEIPWLTTVDGFGTVSKVMGKYAQPLYPPHCIKGTAGACFFDGKQIGALAQKRNMAIDTNELDMIFRRGTHPDVEYDSALRSNKMEVTAQSVSKSGQEHELYNPTGLYYFFDGLKRRHKKITISVCGMPTDKNLRRTVIDLIDLFFDAEIGDTVNIRILKNLCVGTSEEAHLKALDELKDWGCIIDNWDEDVYHQWQKSLDADPYALQDEDMPDDGSDSISSVEEYIWAQDSEEPIIEVSKPSLLREVDVIEETIKKLRADIDLLWREVKDDYGNLPPDMEANHQRLLAQLNEALEAKRRLKEAQLE